LVERDKIGFISVPWTAVPSSQSGSMGIMVDKTSRHLPPSCQAVVVSGTHGADPAKEAEKVAYFRVMDRKDRFLLRPLTKGLSFVPGLHRDYHFRSFFHRFYIQHGAAILAEQEVDSIVFPLYPQWAPRIKALNPQARLILWMQCEWLSSGPAYFEKYLEHIDRVVCCSDYIKEKIAQRFPRIEDRLRTIPNGVDTRVFSPSLGRSRHLILYAGRITPEKGAHVLLRAFEQLLGRYPDAQLVLAGPFWITEASHLVGSSHEEVRQWKSLGKRYESLIRRDARRLKNVFLTGHVPHRSLVRMYSTASVFVHPSLWNEPFGMILAEAMACGVPVVASRCGGIPEVVQDGRTGILTEPGDVEELVEALERLFDSRETATRMGAAARGRAEESFDWERVAEMMAEVATER
jgi:glycosyltransferase involved in cell wall biosynthesis